jgi:elongation factor Tu
MQDPGSFAEEPFRMTVENVFSIASRGTVVTGRVETGTLRVNDPVTFQSADGRTRQTKVKGLETFRQERAEVHAGDNVGVLLKGVGPDEIGRGMALVRAGSPAAPRY